ncbi:MAG: hypothetical protein F4Z55_02700 [Boseongicola sp. SB0667_bin_21]|nr:hypothetical protein [Boseongicola sp. SB0667_bin_21]
MGRVLTSGRGLNRVEVPGQAVQGRTAAVRERVQPERDLSAERNTISANMLRGRSDASGHSVTVPAARPSPPGPRSPGVSALHTMY